MLTYYAGVGIDHRDELVQAPVSAPCMLWEGWLIGFSRVNRKRNPRGHWQEAALLCSGVTFVHANDEHHGARIV